MGTIANKLTYLNGTKTALKDTINMSNAGITNETTFRDYAKKLRNGYIDIINNGTNDLYNNMPHLTGKSKELSLSPSYEAPMKITCFGDTTQYTTTGKNLWENRNATTNIPSGEITITETGFSYTRATTGGKYYYKKINVVNGTKYTFSLTSNPNNTAEVYVYSDIIYGTIVGHAYNSFTFTANETKEYVFAVIISSDKNSVDVSNIQLEIGNSATSYEPYTGGIPAPNPNFPQDIEVVKGYSNLLPTNIETIESSGLTFTRLSDGSYKINGTSNANHTFELYTGDSITIPAGTYTGNIGNRTNIVDGYIRLNNGDYQTIFSSTKDTNTFTISSSFTFNRFYIYITTGKTFNNQIIKPMLNEGNTPLYFVPYGSNYAYTKITAKNMFNKNNITSGKLVDVNGSEVGNNSYGCSDYIKVKGGTTYTRQNCNNYYGAFYDNNKNFVSAIQNSASITPSVDGYVRISFLLTNIDSVQLEKGSTATTYEAYNGTEYVIKLGTTELCKIVNYEDIIFKNETTSTYYDNTLDLNEWYIKKNIGKVVLNGSEENWTKPDNSSYSNDILRYRRDMNNVLIDSFVGSATSNYFKGGTLDIRNEESVTTQFSVSAINIFIDKSRLSSSTIAGFKVWLSTHNTEVYYVLATPTYTKITDSETISQLEALKSKNGTTNITSDMVLDVIVLKNE